MESNRIIAAALILFAFFNAYNIGVSAVDTFGDCVAEKDSCRDCYLTLTRELFKRDDNVYNLSKAFFPPDTNPPEFVKITYLFIHNGVMNDSQTWYWVSQSSYLLFPPHTFQFLSLFFGKPEEYFAQEATVTLNATDCLGVNEDHLTLLTQRLKAFIQRNSFNPFLDNTYSAKSGRKLSDIVDESRHDSVINIVFVFQAFVYFLIIVTVTVVPFISNYYYEWYDKLIERKSEEKEALLFSVAAIGILLTIYILILDVLAMNFNYRKETDSMLKEINESLHHMPLIVLGFYIFSCVIIIFILLCNLCCKCFEYSRYNSALLIIFFYITIAGNHLPFITIAYLNDAYHAGSILIFYVFSFLILLSVFEIFFYTILAKNISIKLNNKNADITIICKGSSLSLYKQTPVTHNTKTPKKSQYESLVLEEFNAHDHADVQKQINDLMFDEATSANMSSFELTLQVGKVEEGKLTKLCIKFDPTYLNKFKEESCDLLGDDKFLLDIQLLLNNTKQISAKGMCKFKSINTIQHEQGILEIDEVVLNNESKPKSCCTKCMIITGLLFLIFFTLASIAFTAAYLVLIPINRSISDAPDRLIGVYQTIILLFGIYIGYKTFFKREITLQSVVQKSEISLSSRKTNTQWSSMSKEERLEEFYKTKAEIIKNHGQSCHE